MARDVYDSTKVIQIDPTTGLPISQPSVSSGGAMAIDAEGKKPTYSVSEAQAVPAASPTDLVVIQGSATKTIRIRRVFVRGTSAAAGQQPVLLIRRSSAPVGGTSSAPAIAKHDTNDAAPTAVVSRFTANPTTVGTFVAIVVSTRAFSNTSTGGLSETFAFDCGTRGDEAIVLRGTGDFLVLSLGTTTMYTLADYHIEWTEE